ncbi:ParB/RepB/Spo0J family partition protein [Calditerrivibrio nitroreducens]|uniref:ParB-like partition protein n=1 Tax=Calditerrivibrio nitroreducens (strain DSM 19672 / NBRC 101217 / Yu37-1) TaxID=768670 RepID=E4TJE6_CALNY|nr:ParB/RepB/Spo0J family partition protein [Calditerrivibrio nitroreducens]ADR19213.1 parB-like partition protein [Calditerrivibrio nitroreducens DSM 19672]
MIKKSPLGRGLDSLIPKSADTKSVLEVDIDEIVPNKEQPRVSFEEEKLKELANSIKEKGIIQPLIVTNVGGRYQIIAGERRWRAAGMAGLKKVPVIVKSVENDREKLELALIENLQREDLNPVEVAKAYKLLIEKYDYTQEQLAQIVGKNRSTVANSLRILNLHPKIIEALSQNLITEGHARSLIGLESSVALQVLQKIIDKGLTVREVEKLVKNINNPKRLNENRGNDLFIESIKKEMEEIFKTKIQIKPARKGGKIELIYKSNEELNTILAIIRGERC